MIKLWTPRRWVEQRVAHVLDHVANKLAQLGDQCEQIGDNNSDGVCEDSHGGLSCHTAETIDTLYYSAKFVQRWADEVRSGTQS